MLIFVRMNGGLPVHWPRSGGDVEFILKSERKFTSSADIKFDKRIWESKSPESQKPSQWEKNLQFLVHRARKQHSVKGLIS